MLPFTSEVWHSATRRDLTAIFVSVFVGSVSYATSHVRQMPTSDSLIGQTMSDHRPVTKNRGFACVGSEDGKYLYSNAGQGLNADAEEFNGEENGYPPRERRYVLQQGSARSTEPGSSAPRGGLLAGDRRNLSVIAASGICTDGESCWVALTYLGRAT